MNKEKIKQIIVENKIWTAAALFLLLMALGISGLFISSMNTSTIGEASNQLAAGEAISPQDRGSSDSYVRIQEGQVQIKSENIEQDVSSIRNLAELYDGWIESSSKNHGELYTAAEVTVKVPSKDFQSFINDLKQDYNVESYSVENYRLNTEKETDELDILNETLKDYEAVRKEINAMSTDPRKLELLMEVTEKQLDIKEKENNYENQLRDNIQRGNYATVNIDLKEERKIKLVPEDLDQRFKSEVNDMVDNVTVVIINTLTGGIEIFFIAIKYIFYLIVVAVPASIAYKLARKLYTRFF